MLKRLFDLTLAIPAFFLLSPIFLSIAAGIGISMGRPILFKQLRPGFGKRPFRLYKFRTMSNARDGDDNLLADAQRLTPFGKFLRSSSMDELPELLNIINGDMSLVGPRPLLMQYLDRYTSEQIRRHDVKPGLTGWAQVNGRNAVSWEDKFRMDVWYVDNRSFWLDLKIIARTFKKVAKREGISQNGEATMTEFMGSESGTA
jgi:sugar transferase EpsL